MNEPLVSVGPVREARLCREAQMVERNRAVTVVRFGSEVPDDHKTEIIQGLRDQLGNENVFPQFQSQQWEWVVVAQDKDEEVSDGCFRRHVVQALEYSRTQCRPQFELI